jgi:hypothetical protein
MRQVYLARGAILLLAFVSLRAQTLLLPPSVVTRGASGTLLLTLQSPSGRAPLALQWEFTFPQNVAVDLADIVAGSAAESAEKSLTCRVFEKTKDSSPGSVYGCILAGGVRPIPNGPVAIVRYRVPAEIRQIAGRVQVKKAVGVTADLKKIEIEGVQAAIIVK